MGLAKKFIHNMLWKNPDKHFGQPHINDSQSAFVAYHFGERVCIRIFEMG